MKLTITTLVIVEYVHLESQEITFINTIKDI